MTIIYVVPGEKQKDSWDKSEFVLQNGLSLYVGDSKKIQTPLRATLRGTNKIY